MARVKRDRGTPADVRERFGKPHRLEPADWRRELSCQSSECLLEPLTRRAQQTSYEVLKGARHLIGPLLTDGGGSCGDWCIETTHSAPFRSPSTSVFY